MPTEDPYLKLRRDADITTTISLCVGIPFLLVAFWLAPSYFEARTYRKLTGADVTMWDAMWVQLRVQDSAD
jgi:hypothetical protein